MSAVVCGKRLLLDDLHGSPPITKRRRCVGGSLPLHFPSAAPSRSGFARPSESGSPASPCLEDQLLQLRSLFPHMDPQIVERVLDSCDSNLDSAIKSLHELCLHAREEIPPSVQTVANCSPDLEDFRANKGASMQLPEWVEMLVTEMMSATDLDDARARASRALEAFEKSVLARSGATVHTLQKEVGALKGQLQDLLRDNQILKRAVTIQHERQVEHDEQSRELQQLKQLLTQYQEQVRTLELNNYALSLHLRKAQEGSSIPGRFHPDVF